MFIQYIREAVAATVRWLNSHSYGSSTTIAGRCAKTVMILNVSRLVFSPELPNFQEMPG
jgi:hypothetical protein